MLDVLDRALALHQAPLFSALSPDELLPLAELCSNVELAAGEPLFGEGEPGDSLYVVVSGRVAVEQGGRRVAELGAGECVGELSVLDWEPRSAGVAALEACELVRLERDDLLDQLGDHPELVRALAMVLTQRLRQTQARRVAASPALEASPPAAVSPALEASPALAVSPPARTR